MNYHVNWERGHFRRCFVFQELIAIITNLELTSECSKAIQVHKKEYLNLFKLLCIGKGGCKPDQHVFSKFISSLFFMLIHLDTRRLTCFVFCISIFCSKFSIRLPLFTFAMLLFMYLQPFLAKAIYFCACFGLVGPYFVFLFSVWNWHTRRV